MLLSPDSLLRAFKVELVLKRPDIFKIKCLSDIKGLFGEDSSPFYAGFGNKTTDSKSYQAVGIPRHRIYRINHRVGDFAICIGEMAGYMLALSFLSKRNST